MDSLGHGRSDSLNPNAHTADWTKLIGTSTAAFCVVVLVLRYVCCSVNQGRTVNDTDAPELEEFNNSEGRTARRVDSVRIKAGRYISAAPLVAADEPEAAAWEGRPKEARRQKATRKGRPSRTHPV